MAIIQDLQLTHHGVMLKTLTPELLPAMSSIATDPEIWAHTTSPLATADEFQALWFDKAIAQLRTGKRWPFAIFADGAIAGSSSYYEIDPDHRRLAIGYTWYARPYWGTALNTTVKLLMLGYAFDTLACARVGFYVDQANVRSCKAMLKLGAEQEGILRNHMIRPNGTHRHTVVFGITDSDWPRVKQRLFSRLTEQG